MRTIFFYLIIYFASPIVFGQIQQNQSCLEHVPDQTPTSRYIIDELSGTVTDDVTGLMWQRCSLGQTSFENQCIGNASTYNWQGALQAGSISSVGGYSDWRLPNVNELNSLIAYNCYQPATNISVFPNMPIALSEFDDPLIYWSSSPSVSSGQGWVVDFSVGYSYTGSGRAIYNYVRLVR